MFERIDSLMKQHGINGLRLALDTGLPKNAVSSWKSGKFKPSTDAIIKIADYFNVSADYLLRGDAYTNSNISNSVIAQGQNARAINGTGDGLHTNEGSEELSELTRIYNSLSVKKRVELLQRAWELEGE
jgi:transcriptional regulator with XRE-family HTH domain